MATENKILLTKNLRPSKKFAENQLEGAICLDVLNDENVQALIYEYDGKRYLPIKIVKRRNVTKFNSTHFLEVDQFKSKSKAGK